MKAFVMALLLASVASAEDQQACRHDGDHVVCTETGFTKITHRYLEIDSALKLCTAQQKLIMADNERLDAGLRACTEIVSKPPSREPIRVLHHAGYVMGVVGTALLTAAPFVEGVSNSQKAAMLVGGISAVTLGYVFIF